MVQNRLFVSLERRNRLGLTQKELAKRTDIPLSTIQVVEQEKVSTIRLETARRLARVLGTTMRRWQRRSGRGRLRAPSPNRPRMNEATARWALPCGVARVPQVF